MAMKTTVLALLLAVTPAGAFGQSLVVASNDVWAVSASYGYSQRHHTGAWIRVDVGLQSTRQWTIQPHEAFHMLTRDGERIDLPDQRAYRRGLGDIRAIDVQAAAMQLSPWLAFDLCKDTAFLGNAEVGAIRVYDDSRYCLTWRLWGNGGVDFVATVAPFQAGGASLYFEAPGGTWPDGQYTLVVNGPRDLPSARLPINLIGENASP